MGRDVPFADRVAALVEERRSQIVLGLDPDPSAVAGRGRGRVRVQAAPQRRLPCGDRGDRVRHVSRSSCSSPASSGSASAAGWRSSSTVAAARSTGCLVLADGKRGDVPVTARRMRRRCRRDADGPFGTVPGLGADAFTANPLLGRDSLEPLVEAADAWGRAASCSCALRTRGPRTCRTEPARARSTSARAHRRRARPRPRRRRAGLFEIGAVTGATRPELLEQVA